MGAASPLTAAVRGPQLGQKLVEFKEPPPLALIEDCGKAVTQLALQGKREFISGSGFCFVKIIVLLGT